MPALGSLRCHLGLSVALAALALGLTATPALARFVYTSSYDNSTVSVIDTATNQVVGAPIPVVQNPGSIAIAPNGKTAYVASEGTAGITVIDTLTNRPVTEIPLEIGSNELAISPDGSAAYATSESPQNLVRVIDLRTNQVVGPPIPVGERAESIALTPDGRFAYVSERVLGEIHVIDTQARQVVGAPIQIGDDTRGIAFAPDGKTAYASIEDEGSLRVIDTQSRQAIATIPVDPGEELHGLAISPDGTRAYVVSRSAGSVYAIDTRTRQVIAGPIQVGDEPHEIAMTPSGRTAYVANYKANSVSAIDTQTNRVVRTIPVGGGPWRLAIVPNQSPVASFAAKPWRSSLQVDFAGSASDPDGTVSVFNWGFGDGASAANAGATLSHAYANGGNFTASLTVVDNEGCPNALVFTGRTAYCSGSAPASLAIRVNPNDFRFGKLTRNARKGTAKLRLRLPAPGKVVLSGRQVKRVKRSAAKAGLIVLGIKPKAKLRKALGGPREGVITRIRVSFTPKGGTRRTKSKPILLVQR